MGFPFSLVLHTHLPMVVNHGRWPHGTDWLNEAAFECYLPLLETAHRLVADGVSPKWTINISPILAEQLASPEFQKELAFYYENLRRACVESREHFVRAGQKEIVGLTHFWEEFYERMWELHRRIGGDIPGTFAELQRGGHVEIITCAATHGYLPLLSRDESIHLQLRTAVEAHRRHFGQAPRGIWLPECAYRPRYEWTPPTGRDRTRRVRPGIEEMLAAHGLEYFVADSHLVSAGQPVFLYQDYIPLKGQVSGGAPRVPVGESRSPYAPYYVASRGGAGRAVAFFRDPRTTLQVWSRSHGYPGDFSYLEFHKKHYPGGLRFWRITDAANDLGTKQVYDPRLAVQKVAAHARHFAELVRETIEQASGDGPALLCSPYDAELFGHWWFEGPPWLEQTARELARRGVQPMTLGEALAAVPPRATLALPEGSWGEGGDHRVWLNPDTEWTWDRVYSAEAEWVDHLRRAQAAGDDGHPDLHRVLTQATRELLLLEASDWQFLITTGAARDYAERRVAEHYAEFKRLSEMAHTLEGGEPLSIEAANTLRRLEREDFCFPDLDPAWGQAPPSPA